MKNESRAYNVWSEKEEQALMDGVWRHGVGSWEVIRQDKRFSILKHRSGVQLKDKWRNFVKYGKLNGKELRNLPRRAAGPWSKNRRESERLEVIKGGRECVKRGGNRCEDRRYGIYDCRRYARVGASDDSDLSTHECESAVVACPCGIDFDDGKPMVECEECKEWAHTTCLRMTIEKMDLARRYVCGKCGERELWSSTMRANDNGNEVQRKVLVSPESVRNSSTSPSPTAPPPPPLKLYCLPFPAPFAGLSVTTAAYLLTEMTKRSTHGGGGSSCSSGSESEKCHSVSHRSTECFSPAAVSAIHSNSNTSRKRKQPYSF